MNGFSLVLTTLVTAVSPYMMQVIKKGSTWFNGLSTWPKRAVLLALTIGLTYLGTWLGFPLPTTMGGFTDPVINGLLTAVLGHFAYKLFPSAAPAPAPPVADKVVGK